MSNPYFGDGQSSVWLSAGQVGHTYRITNQIVTTAGRRKSRSFHVMIEEE